jgi:predicted nucleotidyltransferase
MSNQIGQTVNLNQQVEPVIQALKEGLGGDLVALVLFGSQARGEATPTSDWDILLIAHSLPEQTFQRHLYLKEMIPSEWRSLVAVIAKTPEEFESHLSDLFLDIATDGIILYDTNDYVTKRLNGLRRLIRNRGLSREKIQQNFVWRWQKFPGVDWSLDWSMMQ